MSMPNRKLEESNGEPLARAGQDGSDVPPVRDDTLVELRVDVPGNNHGRYEFDHATGALRLVEVVYPAERRPADLCSVIDSLDESESALGAVLLGNLSHPHGCRLWGRLLGAIEIPDRGKPLRVLLTVAGDDPHFDGVAAYAALPEGRRRILETSLRQEVLGETDVVRWLSIQEAQAAVLEARQRFRVAQIGTRKPVPRAPAWKPTDSPIGETPAGGESERHTKAEYSISALPHRFQRYVEEYLARDERVLLALHRPSMRSATRGGLVRRTRLEEGVFVLSDQQVTEVVELMPPDTAGIRYGFVARSGAPERLDALRIVPLSREVIGLEVSLRAVFGCEKVVWEFPAAQRIEIESVADALQDWLPRGEDHRIRRASPPPPPEIQPPLRDPAANSPQEVEPLAARLQARLDRWLASDETVLARCLLPAWVEGRGAASLLSITNRRLLVVPDPADGRAARLHMNVPLASVSSLEFCSTLVLAYLRLFVPRDRSKVPTIYTIGFGKTLAAMDNCYLMLRRALGTAPIDSPEQESTDVM